MKKVILIVLAFIVFSCNGYKSSKTLSNSLSTNRAGSASVPRVMKEEPLVVRINTDIKPLYDSISTDNIIDNVSLKRLETNEKSYLGDCDVKIVGDHYVLITRNLMMPKVKVFDLEGAYQTDVLTIGRGPKELPMVYTVSMDYNNSDIVIHGPGKILRYNILTRETEEKNVDNNHSFRKLTNLNNNNYMAVDNAVNTTGSKERFIRPVFYYLNSDFIVTDSIFAYKAIQRNIDGAAPSPTICDQLYECDGRVLLKEEENDTVFLVNNDKSLSPIVVFDIPKKLTPTIKNSELDKQEKKDKMVYIRNIVESKDYVFVTYRYRGLDNTGVWDKRTGIYVYSFSAFAGTHIMISIEGRHIFLPFSFVEWESNTIISTVPAINLVGIIDGVKEDDNPVVVKVKLK